MRNANGLLEEDGFILRPGSRTIFGSFGVQHFCVPRRSWALVWRGRTLIWRGLGAQFPRVLRDQSGCERSVWVEPLFLI